jgi:hypothetical protein
MPYARIFPPEVQNSGAGILAVVGELRDLQQVGLRILARHGIVDPVADGWYPLQSYLEALREIGSLSGPATLEEVGRRIPETAKWPPQVNSIETALGSIDAAYHLNLRGGEVGSYRLEKGEGRTARIVCDNPFPCPFDRGLVARVAEKFAPAGVVPSVQHDEAAGCREKGAKSCVYVVRW